MTRELYKTLVAGTSALAVTLALGASAQAFDTVQWDWIAEVESTVTTNVEAVAVLVPTGINQAENSQNTQGDVTSFGVVSNVLITPDLAVVPPFAIDDLALVEVGGQSMGNSGSITSDVSVQYDSLQVLSGLDPATLSNITADSVASIIGNAAVDSAATAVGNNLTVAVEYTDPQNALAIGNNVQTALVNAAATSTVDTVAVTSFEGLGTLTTPLISSKATAVGNNFSAKVFAAPPVVPVP